MERVTLFVVAIVATAAFQVAFRFARPLRVWPVALILILVGTSVTIWFDRHAFDARSPIAAIIPMWFFSCLLSQAILGSGCRF